MTIGHTYRMRTQGTLMNKNVEFGLHLVNNVSAMTTLAILSDFVANIVPLAVAASSSQINWNQVTCQDTLATGDATTIQPLSQPHPGALAGDVLPPQDTVVVRLMTATKGKRFMGRFYFPGITEAGSTNGVLVAPQLTAIQALATGILTFYGPSGTSPNLRAVVFSGPTPPFKPKPAPPVHTDSFSTQVNNTIVDINIRTQRRRGLGERITR